MGMYTELFFKAEIKGDVPTEVRVVLEKLFTDKVIYGDINLPDHPFFKCHRWDCIGNRSSFYHIPFPLSDMREIQGNLYITSRSDLKNYDGEIEKFIDWVTPYIKCYGETCVGWSWYEEVEKPTLIII